MAYHDDTALDGRWETLCSRTSRRQDRPIQWPVPAVLRTDAYEAALAQRELGYKADEHFTRVPITLPFAWNVNPFRDKAWAIRLMCLQPMDAYFYAYDQTGQSAFLHDAIAILLDWCDFHIRKRQRSYMAWADMAVGYRALKLARVIDHLLSGELVLDQVAIDTILDGAVRHMTELLQPEKISLGNHGIFQMHALRVLGEIYWNCPLSDKAILFSEEKLQSLLYRQFNQEGMHLEHSAKYHFWMAAELRALLSSGWHNGDYFHALELNIEEAKNWLVDPSGNLVENGDTPPSKPPRLSVPPRPDLSTSAYQLRCFFDGGYAICRSPSAHLFFAAAYHSNAHKHADDLHVSLFDLGRRILVDSGTVGYKGDARREYVLSTRAHNTVEVDGQSYPRDGTDSYGSGLISAKGYTNGVELIGRVQHRSLSVVHERHLRYIPGKVLEVEDLLESDVPRHFAQWFHFAPYFTVEVISPNSAVACAGDIRVELFSNCSIGSVVRGATNPMQGWTAQKIDVLEPSYALSFVARGTKAEIHTRVSIAPYDAHPVLGELLWSRECLN